MDRVSGEVRAAGNRSTGPRTEEGKARSSRNALKHGLRAKKFVMCDENPDAFQEYRIELMNELAPLGTMETALADRIAQTIWRLNRCMGIEAEMFDHERSNFGGPLRTLGEVFARPNFGGPGGVMKLTRYETALQRLLTSLTRELHRMQDKRNAENPFRLGADGQAPATKWLLGTHPATAGEFSEEQAPEAAPPRPEQFLSPAPDAAREPNAERKPTAERGPVPAPEQRPVQENQKISKRTPPPQIDGEFPLPEPSPLLNAPPVWSPAAPNPGG